MRREKKGDGNGVTKRGKREVQEKISGCSEGGYGESWCKEEDIENRML